MNNYEFLDKLAKKASKGKLVLLLIVLAIMVAMIGLNFNNYQEAKKEPTPIDLYELSSENIDKNVFYELELTEDFYLFETAMFEGEEIDTFYMATIIQEGVFIVEVSGDFDFNFPHIMKGRFKSLESDVESALLAELKELDPNGQYTIMKYTFKADSFDADVFLIILAIVAIIFTLIMFSFIKSLKFKSSKLYKNMKKLGDPDTIADEIEREVEMSKNVSEGPIHLFTNYIISGTNAAAFILPRESVIWCYPKVTKVKRYFITVSTRHEIIMGTKDGKTKLTTSKEEEVKRVMNMMQGHHPACVYGYSEQIEQLFKKNRDEFIRIAEDRRAEDVEDTI